MSQRDGFGGGFIAGALVGGVVGGVIGALLGGVRSQEAADTQARLNNNLPDKTSAKRRQMKASAEQSIEVARRSLEDKIAQLNETIDEVRLTLGNVNGSQPEGNAERSLPRDP